MLVSRFQKCFVSCLCLGEKEPLSSPEISTSREAGEHNSYRKIMCRRKPGLKACCLLSKVSKSHLSQLASCDYFVDKNRLSNITLSWNLTVTSPDVRVCWFFKPRWFLKPDTWGAITSLSVSFHLMPVRHVHGFTGLCTGNCFVTRCPSPRLSMLRKYCIWNPRFP